MRSQVNSSVPGDTEPNSILLRCFDSALMLNLSIIKVVFWLPRTTIARDADLVSKTSDLTSYQGTVGCCLVAAVLGPVVFWLSLLILTVLVGLVAALVAEEIDQETAATFVTQNTKLWAVLIAVLSTALTLWLARLPFKRANMRRVCLFFVLYFVFVGILEIAILKSGFMLQGAMGVAMVCIVVWSIMAQRQPASSPSPTDQTGYLVAAAVEDLETCGPSGLDPAEFKAVMRWRALFGVAFFSLLAAVSWFVGYQNWKDGDTLSALLKVGAGSVLLLPVLYLVQITVSARSGLRVDDEGIVYLGRRVLWRNLGTVWRGKGATKRYLFLAASEDTERAFLRQGNLLEKIMYLGSAFIKKRFSGGNSIVIHSEYLSGRIGEIEKAIRFRHPRYRRLPHD